MRVLVEPSDYTLRNAGDTAMLQTAISRVRHLWPDATIEVFARNAEALRAKCAGVTPVSARGRDLWTSAGALNSRRYRRLPATARHAIRSGVRYLKRAWPTGVEAYVKGRLASTDEDTAIRKFLDTLSNADLFIATGMGALSDTFAAYSLELLEIAELAKSKGAVTAFLGQGIGPITKHEVFAAAAAILPEVDLIGLREGLHSAAVLRDIGVSFDRVVVTGDEAIEMSYNRRPDRLGYGLGVNIRVAPYAGITHDHVNAIRSVLRGRAQAFHAPVIPVAISANPEEADAVSIEKLLAGCDLSIERCNEDTDPGHVIDAIHRCRVVVTGSYHAGVFALSSGIPAVGLAASDYYRAKFHGLAHQFGEGCTVIDLDQRESSETLSTAIDQAWRNAEVLRPKLLARAADQVERGRLAYRRIYDLVEARSHARPRKTK